MNSRYERENGLDTLQEAGEQDREISLGTATILGIFFVLAMLCAVFFGFGYSLGRRSAPRVVNASEANTEPDGTLSKPAPDSPVNQSRTSSASGAQADSAAEQNGSPVSSEQDTQQGPAPERTVIAATPATSAAKPHSGKAVSEVAATSLEAGPGALVVQVAAVSHQGDADMLAAALKKRGYDVLIRPAAQDKLLHVQVGPFASKKDADAMRQRLQADGYNAIVK